MHVVLWHDLSWRVSTATCLRYRVAFCLPASDFESVGGKAAQLQLAAGTHYNLFSG
jgi:hypothetical protein